MTETVFNIASSLLYEWQCRSLLLPSGCDWVCFSKNLDVYYKWQWWSLLCSNLRVAQNGRFLKKPLYLTGGTMVPVEGRFRALWKPKKWTLQDLLLSQVIRIKMNFVLSSRELYWISTWHNIRNFNQSLFSFIAFLIVWKSQTVLILKLVLGTSLASAKAIRALVYADLLLMIRW